MAIFTAGPAGQGVQGLRLVYAGSPHSVVWRGGLFFLRRLSPSRPIFSELFCRIPTAHVFLGGLLVLFYRFRPAFCHWV